MLTDDQLARLSPAQLALLAKLAENKRFNHIDFWKPYPKQQEFFALGATKQERLLTAGNQVGKSDTGAAEAAFHLTGLYPEWWQGRKWDRPTEGWICSESTTVGRDVAQTKLCGPAGVTDMFGTGFVPKSCFVDRPTLARGAVADAYDTIQVYHHTDGQRDGISTAQFKSYEQGRKKFQGKTNDWCWWDEEPDAEIYTEGNARWSATGGMSWMTFTPLLGLSDVVNRFLEQADDRRGMIRMSVHDAAHMTEAMIADLKAKYPSHEWDARIDGYPKLGSGRIFTIDEKLITFPVDQRLPEHFAYLWGIDFGITHPFAAVLVAWDRDTDTLYVVATYRAADTLPIVHADAIRRICEGAPVAWPHDGARREAGSGESLAKVYKKFDLHMLPTHSHFAAGGYSTEAAVLEMQQRFADGRLKVREDLADFFGEYRMYHRKDGLIVKVRDDLLSAMQKVIMMKRFSKPVKFGEMRMRSGPRQQRLLRAPPRDPWTGREIRLT